MNEKNAPSVGGIKPLQSGADLQVQAHLGRKLRELFEAPPGPLTQRLMSGLRRLLPRQKSAVNDSLRMPCWDDPIAGLSHLACGNTSERTSGSRRRCSRRGATSTASRGHEPSAALHHPTQLYFSELRSGAEVETGRQEAKLFVAPANRDISTAGLQGVGHAFLPIRGALVLVEPTEVYEEADEIAHCAVGHRQEPRQPGSHQASHILGVESGDHLVMISLLRRSSAETRNAVGRRRGGSAWRLVAAGERFPQREERQDEKCLCSTAIGT